jgi:hypothetical protein
MTTILPEPVAILRAIRGRPGLDWSFASRSWFSIQGVAVLLGDLGDVDGCLQGFNLTEEELALAFRLGPILEELACRGRYAKVSPFAPQADALADAVDSLVLLDAVLRPFGVEWKLLVASPAGLGDGEEVRAYSPLFDDVVRNALLVEAEVPRRLVEGRV